MHANSFLVFFGMDDGRQSRPFRNSIELSNQNVWIEYFYLFVILYTYIHIIIREARQWKHFNWKICNMPYKFVMVWKYLLNMFWLRNVCWFCCMRIEYNFFYIALYEERRSKCSLFRDSLKYLVRKAIRPQALQKWILFNGATSSLIDCIK